MNGPVKTVTETIPTSQLVHPAIHGQVGVTAGFHAAPVGVTGSSFKKGKFPFDRVLTSVHPG